MSCSSLDQIPYRSQRRCSPDFGSRLPDGFPFVHSAVYANRCFAPCCDSGAAHGFRSRSCCDFSRRLIVLCCEPPTYGITTSRKKTDKESRKPLSNWQLPPKLTITSPNYGNARLIA